MTEATARIARLQGFLREDPDNVSLLAQIVDLLIENSRAKEALPYLDHALTVAPGNDSLLYLRAVALRRSADVTGARALLEQLAAKTNRASAVLYELADLHFAEREFERCIERLGALSDEDRHATVNADLLLVRALHYLGRIEEAIAIAESAIASVQQPALLGALASLYLDDERYEDAARIVQSARESGQSSPEILSVSGYLALAGEEPTAAAKRFAEALASRPRDGRSLLGAGLAAAAEGQVVKSIVWLQRAADAMPTHLGTLNALAWMQVMSGQLDDASDTLKRAQQVDDSFSETYGAQAVVAAHRGQVEEARALIRTALRLDRDCFGAAYAEMLLRHGKDSAALQSSSLEFLARQTAPGGGTLKDAVLRLGRRAQRSPSGGGRPN